VLGRSSVFGNQYLWMALELKRCAPKPEQDPPFYGFFFFFFFGNILNDIITYLPCRNKYTIKSMKCNMNHDVKKQISPIMVHWFGYQGQECSCAL
jgi:hypothetical protein